MKTGSTLWLTMILCSGCAHGRRVDEKVNTKPAPAISGHQTTTLDTPAAGVKVNLPYTFSRHGVEVRVYSIEFSADKLIVTTALQETRGIEVDLDGSLLIKAQSPSGETFAFVALGRDGQGLPMSTIHLKPKERAAVTLSYALGTNVGKPLELHFPTGKWWSSVRDSAQ